MAITELPAVDSGMFPTGAGCWIERIVPAYSTMRSFRQSRSGDWLRVFDRVHAALVAAS